MRNALTIDVEDWYHTKEFDFERGTWPDFERRIDYGLNQILDLLDKYNVKATFFILGCVAAEHPELVRRINSKGHHIGSHGSYHELVYRQTKSEFLEDISSSKKLLEDITGNEVTYFRASSWSIGKENLWALELLEQAGFKVGSSLQPFRTPLSGMTSSPLEPFYPIVDGHRLNFLEFPVGVLPIGNMRFPFAGGFYLRAIPMPIIKGALTIVNRSRETAIYTHPWEYDDEQPRIKANMLKRFLHYYNIGKTHTKLESLLNKFEFAPMSEIIKGKKYEAIAL